MNAANLHIRVKIVISTKIAEFFFFLLFLFKFYSLRLQLTHLHFVDTVQVSQAIF
jgi:hypothetical protein